MAKKKLTPSLKAKIKSDYSKLKLSDFEGEALSYLKKVRGAAKGRKTQRESKAVVDDFEIPKDSELYDIVKKAAKLKKMSVKRYISKYKEELKNLLQEGDFVVQRETEYLIEDISKLKKGKKVFVNDGNGYIVRGRNQDILNIQQFTQHVLSHTDIFLIIYRVHYKLSGDLSHYLPDAEEYEGAEDPQSIEEVLDSYYPEITYLKSDKTKGRKKDSRIPGRRSKKEKGAKGKSNNGRQRKSVHKVAQKK